MLIEEIEIGPHFLTFYSKDRSGLIQGLPELYRKFMRAPDFEALKSVQQQGFAHVTNDPNVYHPYGDPKDFREAFSHFHIRTIEQPSEQLIEALRAFIAKNNVTFKDDLLISRLEDNNPNQLTYPPRLEGEEYLTYIDRLKNK